MYSIRYDGMIIMPTDTKKTAPNISLSGLTISSICSPLTVPARIDPPMNAPSASEKPITCEITTIPKQIASARMRSDSSESIPLVFFSKVGSR